jgi:hypothetical protein
MPLLTLFEPGCLDSVGVLKPAGASVAVGVAGFCAGCCARPTRPRPIRPEQHTTRRTFFLIMEWISSKGIRCDTHQGVVKGLSAGAATATATLKFWLLTL